jgi:hypothetical protein
MPELLPDILQHVFQQLAGDNEALLIVSLTFRAWRFCISFGNNATLMSQGNLRSSCLYA